MLTVICLSAQVPVSVGNKQIAQRLVQGLELAYQPVSSAVVPYVMQGHFSSNVPSDCPNSVDYQLMVSKVIKSSMFCRC